MKDLSRTLHEAFCEELNQEWAKAINSCSKDTIDFTAFKDLNQLINEARNTGYTFHHHFDAALFMDACIENEGNNQPDGWQFLSEIENFIAYCTENGWKSVRSKIQLLKQKHIQQQIEMSAVEWVKQYGPFYVGKDLTMIYTYGYTGNSTYDMALICILFGHEEKENI